MIDVLPWIVAAVGLGAAILAVVHARSQAAQIAAARSERDQAVEAARAAEKRAEEKARETRKRGEELGELRKRLDKTRKRAARAQDDAKGEGARIRELEEALRIARADRQSALAALDRAQSAAAPAPPPTAAPSAPESRPEPPAPSESEALAAQRDLAEQAQARLAAIEAELRTAAKEAARYQKKARSLETAYTAQHGELEARKDRMRAMQEELERLRALRAGLAAGAVAVPHSSDPALETEEAPG
ncbi:MAG: hypothetical protein ACQGVK_07905 [Myxococcota bacterium]